VKRIAESCSPCVFLSTKTYIRSVWLVSKMARRGSECVWPSEWNWKATDALWSKLSRADDDWLAAWLPTRCVPGHIYPYIRTLVSI